jgi:uncharacterized protein
VTDMHGTFTSALTTRPSRYLDADGRLHAKGTFSRAGVCTYQGDEFPGRVPRGIVADHWYQLLRGPDELRRSARTFRGLPLLLDHGGPVVGMTGDDTVFDGEYLRGSLVVWDADAIAAVETAIAQSSASVNSQQVHP